MARNDAGLKHALEQIPELREEFWRDVNVPGSGDELNQSLEHAGRVADFLELAELMCLDALHREESCGGHFREEHQTPDGEATAQRRARSPTSPRGNTRATASRRCSTRNRSSSRTCTWRTGATSEATHRCHVWRQTARDCGLARSRRTKRATSAPDMSFLEMLDVVNEGLIAERRGADRVRSRLPRGHLRHVRPDDQRRRRTAR